MPARDDRAIENLIRGSEELIRKLVETGIASGDTATHPSDIEGNIHLDELAALDTLENPPEEARVEVGVSEDGMSAYATFHPPTGDRPPLDLDSVRVALDALKVSVGIDWNAIKDAVLRCNTERVQVTDVMVARGIAPVSATPPVLTLAQGLVERRQAADSPAGRIDYRELSPYTLVKKGDVLASWSPERKGRMGSTVVGEAIAYAKQKAPSLKPGKNTVAVEGRIVAACDGRFQAAKDGFWVDEVLSVAGDVDYHTGNIDFPGDVFIGGDIRDGFTVRAGKSVFCMKSIDACQVDCAGDLVTNQGIIGRKKAIVRVGGLLRARFIEGSYIEAAGSIHVLTSVMNSSIHTLGSLGTGERGIIVGSVVYAQNGVSTAQIGTDRSPRTEVHCGIDYTVEQKLVGIRDKGIALAMKLKEVEARTKSHPEARERLAELRVRLMKAIHQMNESARNLVDKLDRNEEATVSVREAVFPGTYIEICHVSHIVTKTVRFVTFRLDKARGRIMTDKWQKRPRTT